MWRPVSFSQQAEKVSPPSATVARLGLSGEEERRAAEQKREYEVSVVIQKLKDKNKNRILRDNNGIRKPVNTEE